MITAAPDTLVVGAGISGLAFASARIAAGGRVLVLEASPRPGGLVRTITADGWRHEEGPEALPGAAVVRELCRELGVALDEAPRAAAKRYLALDGKLIPLPGSPDELATSFVLSFGAKLRLMAEASCARDEALEGSIADFARHRFGREALERVVEPLVAGIHAGDPEQLSLRACFPEVARMVEEHGSVTAALKARAAAKKAAGAPPGVLGGGLVRPAGGMQRLTDALARALGPALRCDAPVRAIEREHGGFRVHEGGGASHRVEQVVLAVGLGAARELLAGPAPESADALASMAAESLVSVAHGYRRADVGHPLDGFGCLVPRSAGGLVLGTLFSSSIDPSAAPEGHVLLRSLLGGARNPGALALADDELLARVHAECAAPLGLARTPIFARVSRHPAAIPRFDLEHVARRARLAEGLSPGLAVLGNFTRGLGVEKLIAESRALARASALPG